jgi:hypothetical protein
MKALTHFNLDQDSPVLPPHVIRKCEELQDAINFFTHKNHWITSGSPLAVETGYDKDVNIVFNVEGCRVIFFYHYDPALKGFPAYKNGIWGKVLTVNATKFYFYIPFLRVQYAVKVLCHDNTYPNAVITPLLMPPFILNPTVPTLISHLGQNLRDMDEVVFNIQFELTLLQNE